MDLVDYIGRHVGMRDAQEAEVLVYEAQYVTHRRMGNGMCLEPGCGLRHLDVWTVHTQLTEANRPLKQALYLWPALAALWGFGIGLWMGWTLHG